MALTEKEKGEIALALYKLRVEARKRKGIQFDLTLTKREAGNASKESGIPADKIVEFYKGLYEQS